MIATRTAVVVIATATATATPAATSKGVSTARTERTVNRMFAIATVRYIG